MRAIRKLLVGLLKAIPFCASIAHAQQPVPLTLKRIIDGTPAQSLNAAEFGTLGDPLFLLVLKDKANVTSLTDLERLIQPDATKRRIFVVDENIANPARGQSRRSVLTFSGSQGGQVLDSNVMLSVFFDDKEISDNPRAIEAWGWDNARGRYNYYKLDQTGTPEGRLTWKFRGSSDNADLLAPSERRGTCLACHLNGGPVMKELLFPWNNWHSFASQVAYLSPIADAKIRWQVATSVRLKDRLGQAEDLEGLILAPIVQFNSRRINAALVRRDGDGNVAVDGEGFQEVREGKRLLRHLFVTTEFNVISSPNKSLLHPFGNAPMPGPTTDIEVPDSFFLNANLLAGSGFTQYVGLGIAKARQFSSVVKIRPNEYRDLIARSGVKLGQRPGDTDFAWFVPEPSHMDNAMIDRILRAGIVTPEFVAAALSVDLETPVLSAERVSLLQFIPDQFRFKPLSGEPQPGLHPDELTRKTVATLIAANPSAGSAAGKFLQRLQSKNPVDLLSADVDAYLTRIQSRLANPATKAVELQRLFDRAIARRRAVMDDPVLGTINETGNRLFPMPN